MRTKFCDERAAAVATKWSKAENKDSNNRTLAEIATAREKEAANEKTKTGDTCDDKASRKRDRWMRSMKTTIIAIAIAAIAGFVGVYNSRAPKHPAESAVVRSPEIRRAIPVEPEIRKAIPVQPRDPVADLRSMAFTTPIRGDPSATLQHDARQVGIAPK